MSARWWKRNVVWVLAVVILLPASALVIGGREWHDYFASRPSVPVVVEPEESIDFGGATWGPLNSGFANDTSGMNMPADGEMFIIALPVTPHDEAVGCTAPTLVEAATGRNWADASLPLDLRYNSEEPVRCVTDETEPYTIYVPYVIPEGISGPFWVEVAPFGEEPRFLRFVIDADS